jgi:hypothetical protein
MLFIHHRKNLSREIRFVPSKDGVEIDLRSNGERIYLQHDPFAQGEDFETWLDSWNGQFLVLNVKEEGLEDRILKILSERQIFKYFFLDQSFPFLVRTLRKGNQKVAARVSDIESIETALAVDCEWVWIDCFNGDWSFLEKTIPRLVMAGKKICLVSPELVRVNSEIELDSLRSILRGLPFQIDAVCSKVVSLWE